MENQYLSFTKEEVRAVIRFFNFQNVSPTEIHRKLTEVYGPHVMSRKSVSVWCTKFNSGRESVEDEARNGRPISTSTAETIEAVEKLLRSDRRLKIREMATQLDLLKTTVHEIVHEKLNFRKVCSRWVPKMLTPDPHIQRERLKLG
ncbi:protein GVQW3-like [Melanaphis sacchari]|uniref:protein GVQW3-like n=1 Tax=Melanaphis sacchari TaxID=742174 RepID=UPI000DC1468E|nr:protein GVQW3-like [Melanaphis sacchari]